MKSQAFSLLEVVVCCGLFSALAMLLFGALHLGFQAFALGSQRGGGQSQLEVTLAQLKRDLELSTFTSLQIENGVHRQIQVQNQHGDRRELRSLVAFVGMDRWLESTSYDPQSGVPLWNRYWVYHADLKRPLGNLSRVEVIPGNAGSNTGTRWPEWDSYLTQFPDQSPPPQSLGDSRVVQNKRLSDQLLGFEVEATASQVLIGLRLSWQGRTNVTGQKRAEIQEVRLRVVPRNRVR